MKAALFAVLTCICCDLYAQGNGTVTIVDANIIDGVENKIVRVAWHENMNLIEASLFGEQDGFHAMVTLLSGSTATIYGGRMLFTEEVEHRLIRAGDVLVLGPVMEDRAENLDKIPEVHQHLEGVNWRDYKNWLHVHISPKQGAAPSASTSK